MSRSMLGNANLYALQLRIDREILEEVRSRRCPVDGGRLHVANFPRKPRGALCKLGHHDQTRLSLCCANRDCRRRVTPPSVRFLGRRVYLGAAVVLLSTMRHGTTGRRLAQLRELYGVCPRTVQRWRNWWREMFPQTPCWRWLRGRLRTPIAVATQPGFLLGLFWGDEMTSLLKLLKALSPLAMSALLLQNAGSFMGV